MPNKTLIVDDHPLIRTGLIKTLQAHDFNLIFEAGTCAEGRGQLAEQDPDVLIADLHLPDGLSFDLITWARKIKPELAIIILTIESNSNFILAAAQSGANALIHKSAPITNLISAIEVAIRAPKSFSAEGLSNALREEKTKPKLTARELEIMERLITGEEISLISAQLFITIPTVKTHLSSIYRKLACENRTSAVVKALALGLVTLK